MDDSAAATGDELVEWVDEHGDVIEIVTRSRMRAENLRHRSAAVVILSSDGERLLVHRRAETKDLRPGWWDVCAGGVMAVGEVGIDAARRELAEEVGVVDVDLEPLGRGHFDAEDSREISELFLVRHDGPFEFTDGEVAEACFVELTELRAFMASRRFLPSCEAMVLPLVPGWRPSAGSHVDTGHLTWRPVQRVEFTIEPFSEGSPGVHVTAPADALREMGVEVEVGPFGSSCEVGDERVGEIVSTVVRLAVDHGASHVNVDVERVEAAT